VSLVQLQKEQLFMSANKCTSSETSEWYEERIEELLQNLAEHDEAQVQSLLKEFNQCKGSSEHLSKLFYNIKELQYSTITASHYGTAAAASSNATKATTIVEASVFAIMLLYDCNLPITLAQVRELLCAANIIPSNDIQDLEAKATIYKLCKLCNERDIGELLANAPAYSSQHKAYDEVQQQAQLPVKQKRVDVPKYGVERDTVEYGVFDDSLFEGMF